MGIPVLIYGKSGSGKSRSLKNFSEDEIFLVNVERKLMPFRKKFTYELKSHNPELIMQQLAKMPTRKAAIDDAGYLMTHFFMQHHREKTGNASFEMYDSIADIMFNLITFIKARLPDDAIVYIMLHEDRDDFGDVKLLTLGKLLDRKVNMQGMVTICLRCMSENGRHFFRTNTDGSDITKSPEEMFSEIEIENDLKMVDKSIREYYGFEN